MKKLHLISVMALILIPSLFALPLTALIFQQRAKLADEVTAWNKQCGDKPSYDDACMKKRYKISGELGEFVALVNDELEALRNISPNASEAFVKESNGRRKIMELEARNALHIIKCLGVPASDSQCGAESAAIDEEKTALQTQYKETHAAFDGKWISIPVAVSPAPVGSQAPKETVLTTAPSPTVAKPATPNIASIAKEQPYENSLGMKFVPVPETSVLLSIWDTRVQDYEVFAKETRREVVKPSFQQSDVDPVVNVSWNDAKAFCDWLTAKEHKERRLAANQRYRLPTNMEWDCAVGLNCEEDRHPYAWGDEWPPPKNNGNYSPQLAVDPYEYTSPVGAFAANKYGLYDIGGNVLQWCDDWTDNSQKAHLQRGSSWASATRATIQLDAHSAGALNDRTPTLGFRCVTTSLTRNGRTWQTWLGEFVRQFVAANQMQDVDATLASYGSVVDYFDNGQKDQGYIRADIERYIERWPTRHDSIENSNIRFEEKSPDEEYVANFKLDFYAESSARRAWSKGQFDIVLNIMISDGVPKIVQIKEKVTRQQRGNLSGPLTATPGPSASQRLKGRNR
jgi:hypothetical protein